MKRIVPIPRILDNDAFAFIAPHPDDIEIACGGTIAKLTKLGKRVCIIIATDGRYGTQDTNANLSELVQTRQNEAIASAKLLGVSDVRFLGFSDGGDYDIKEMSNKIAIELATFKPDLIFTADNHVKSELHPDHLNTGKATETALLTCSFPHMMKNLGVSEVASPKGIAYYYTNKPNRYVNITKTFNTKLEAISQHISQFLYDENAKKEFKLLSLYMKITAIRFGLRKFCRYAEAFRVLSILHTHCAPEASEF